ncbi:MAG TPA: lysylphosphatidylglycerol synthase transmembrane domain-containing protein [Candidatus Limnocylindrales bacterium]|nr:lysylphosphatidylglycerol synthase transmembrane domain-containing protein [Candidatus Limnocylindrales bacterium]
MSILTRAASPRAGGQPPGDAGGEVAPDQLSIGRRLRQPRTIVSIALPLLLLVLFLQALPGFRLEELPQRILAANPALLAVAFLVYYLGFPLRGARWSLILRGAGNTIRVRDATEIIFLSWLVNCLVPAKLGDLYRAYLLKINSPVSLSRTFGTVFIERVLDLFAIVLFGLASAFVSFRTGLPTEIQLVFAAGIGVVVVLAVGLLTLRNFGRRVLERLPLPGRILEFYDRFEEGVFGSVDRGMLPVLGLLTASIWATEALRLYFVVAALQLPGVHIGLSGAFFVALAGSLMTAVPFTPAGLVVVEGVLFGILTIIYGVPVGSAVAITLVDRAISVVSIIALGSIAYAVSGKRRGEGIPVGSAGEPEPAA